MINSLIKLILIFLLVFSPIAFGSVELWAFSIMELAILFIIVLRIIPALLTPTAEGSECLTSPPGRKGHFLSRRFEICNLKFATPVVLLSVFLLLILFQLLPLPSRLVKILSPKTFELRNFLLISDSYSALHIPHFSISFFPFLTQIEFFKWFTLMGLFIFLLSWKPLEQSGRTTTHLVVVVILVGVFESLYGIFEFFSGHLHILHLDGSALISSVTGTFINCNYFAGYLLMVIPLSIGFLFSGETTQTEGLGGWRERLISVDGKTPLIGFCVVVMILGLLFSASRIGILSLLLSFSLISFLFRKPGNGKRSSKTVVLILGLALLWAAWIGLDAVISRFFTVSESLEERWRFWVDTFRIFRDFPIFGSGLGTFIQVFPMYRSFHISGRVTHAENDYLQLASEVGLLGAGLLLATFLFLFLKAVSRIRSMSSEEPGRYVAIGGLVGILALMFHSLVERNIQIPSNALLNTVVWTIVLKVSGRGTHDSITQ